MDGINWGAEAIRVANYIARHIVDLQRGALVWHQGIIVAFGTDGYATDEKSKDVVQLLTQIVDIPAWKTERLAFGTNDELDAGRTWVLLLDPAQSDDVVGLVESLDTAIWATWDLANGRTPEKSTDNNRRLKQETRLRKLRPPRQR
ncbi:MAG TPA: hypothetical protein VHD36_12895 [Pirellulales bacterium]|nr:hypothetical protein [Pirellulales bacterium]